MGPRHADIGVVTDFAVDLERSRRACRRRVTPRETTDWELDVRTELRQLDRLRPLNIRQQPALQDEYAIRRLGEGEFTRAPRPLFEPGQRADWLRPVRDDVVGAERILAALFTGDGGKRTPRLPLQRGRV